MNITGKYAPIRNYSFLPTRKQFTNSKKKTVRIWYVSFMRHVCPRHKINIWNKSFVHILNQLGRLSHIGGKNGAWWQLPGGGELILYLHMNCLSTVVLVLTFGTNKRRTVGEQSSCGVCPADACTSGCDMQHIWHMSWLIFTHWHTHLRQSTPNRRFFWFGPNVMGQRLVLSAMIRSSNAFTKIKVFFLFFITAHSHNIVFRFWGQCMFFYGPEKKHSLQIQLFKHPTSVTTAVVE